MLVGILLGLALGLALTVVANFSTTVYLHRALTHRAMTVAKPLGLLFRLHVWLFTGIRPRQWVAVHRKHHAYTDTDDDPHSPAILGWKRVQLTNVALYRKVAGDPDQVRRYARDLPQTPLDKYLLDHALVGLAVGTTALVLFVGPLIGGVAAASHTVFYLTLGGTVNGPAHHFGKRPHPNSATNLQWLAWLTCGEGLHNNHHAAPTSARFSMRRGEFDPAWRPISLMRRLGLVTIRHDSPVFAHAEH